MAGGAAVLLCVAMAGIPGTLSRRVVVGGSDHPGSVLPLAVCVRKHQGCLRRVLDGCMAGNCLPRATYLAVWVAVSGYRVGRAYQVQLGCRQNVASAPTVLDLGQHPWFLADWHGLPAGLFRMWPAAGSLGKDRSTTMAASRDEEAGVGLRVEPGGALRESVWTPPGVVSV